MEDRYLRRMHVRLPDGREVSGAEAFVEVWKRVPGFGWLAKISQVPGVLTFGEFLYRPVAWVIYQNHMRKQGRRNR